MPEKKIRRRAQAPACAKREKMYDVIVVGGGPAGSVLGWDLARRGIDVLIIDRARFPREKVCGDYIEPRGLRLLQVMGCLKQLEQNTPLPITHSAMYVQSQCRYRGKIPFYGVHERLPPHGYIISREELDYVLLRTAGSAGTIVHEGTLVDRVTLDRGSVEVEAKAGASRMRYKSRLVIGADGVNSIVARAAGILANDPRHIALSQRAYAEGLEGNFGEAVFYFQEDLFPGYGWMFPMSGGRANLGVGILSETAQRLKIKVPVLFSRFFEKLKRTHPRCAKLTLTRPPIGGIVKTYGGAGPNFFEGGWLIGDAGSFVDPMTGEGITPGMESALLAGPVIEKALESGRRDAEFLATYESAFREYFDPSMIFVDFCAAVMRNHHFSEFWLNAVARGCDVAQGDRDFARTTGATFGGLEIQPISVLWHVWQNVAWEIAGSMPRSFLALLKGDLDQFFSVARDWLLWQLCAWNSVTDDPFWHAGWLMDLQRKWLHVISLMNASRSDPRSGGTDARSRSVIG